jgi:hypothetical protein
MAVGGGILKMMRAVDFNYLLVFGIQKVDFHKTLSGEGDGEFCVELETVFRGMQTLQTLI